MDEDDVTDRGRRSTLPQMRRAACLHRTAPSRVILVMVFGYAALLSATPHPASATPSTAPTEHPAPLPEEAVPGESGTGRRVVYDIDSRRVWLVNADGTVRGTWKVTGRPGTPTSGTYRVFSKSPTTRTPDGKYRFGNMVRFTRAASGVAIGFHDLPYSTTTGKPIMPLSKIGAPEYRSSGCVRQRPADAEILYRWARVGTTVVVLD